MKKIALLFTVMMLSMVANAQTALDVQNSGCLNETRGEETQRVPTIVLTKEGSVLSVQLLNYECDCCTLDFIVTSNISGGNNGDPCLVSINVSPVEEGCDCICPYNLSFTIRDLEPNSFYLDCWWYKGGMVNLTDGVPFVLDGQEEGYYYYNQGKRIPLTLNENRVVVSIPKDCDGISNRIRANVSVLSTINDEVFDTFIISRSDYEQLSSQNFWEEDAKSVVLTSSYFTEDNEEVFETPYLNVKLKKEEDADLLDFYAEENKLVNLGSFSQLLPLWYVLYVTPESEKSPLECANELYESGRFSASVPDLASVDCGIEHAYRPFVEEGKVWKVGALNSGNPVQVVKYYYFEGDTIINGMTCKKMMCQQYVDPDFAESNSISQDNSLSYVGAWYEEDQKVYFCDATNNQFKLMYDFSLDANATFEVDNLSYVIGPRQTGGIEGFKGVHRDVRRCESGENSYSPTWMEGVGSIDDPTKNVYYVDEAPSWCLMSCTVGDEVIYFNDEYEDGATPMVMESRRHRIDFTHTIKTRPRVPASPLPSLQGTKKTEKEESQLYGDYSNVQLGINLDPLNDAYLVCITDETGKAVYEKTINAASIVGLDIDISAYAEGRYTVTVENSYEAFTGEIVLGDRTTGISIIPALFQEERAIYNLHGQRISSLQKGLNIVNGQKVIVK